MPHVILNTQDYERELSAYAQEAQTRALEDHERALSRPPDTARLAREVAEFLGDPHHPLVRAIRDADVDAVGEHRGALYEAPPVPRGRSTEEFDAMMARMKKERQLYDDVRDLTVYLDAQAEETPRDLVREYREWQEELRRKFVAHAAAVHGGVEYAVARVAHCDSEPVVVSVEFRRDSEDPATPGVYEVAVGRGSFGTPSFTLFVNEAGVLQGVDDVLEGGDTDFFDSPQLQGDYFNLVNELRKPGSSARGKVLRLYTARPVRDRARYTDTRELPANIFLANLLEEAEGLARDLGGNEVRDVWVVRVNSRDLVKTLDTPRLQHYQTVRPTPVQGVELVVPGSREASARRVATRHRLLILSRDGR